MAKRDHMKVMSRDKIKLLCDKNCPLHLVLQLVARNYLIAATYLSWLATKYDLFKYDVKTIFSIIF